MFPELGAPQNTINFPTENENSWMIFDVPCVTGPRSRLPQSLPLTASAGPRQDA